MPAWILGTVALLYVVTPFAQIYQKSGRVVFPYPDLFEHSWNNFFIAAVACLFSGVFWAVLAVWAGLFAVIKIDFFQELFTEESFAYIATFTTIGYGLALGRTSEHIISTMRRIALMTAHALLPLVSFVAVLFLVTLAVTGLKPLWETQTATALILNLMGLIVVMFNGVYENGEAALPYNRWMRGMVRAALLTLPVYAVIAYASTKARVDQYGLTPQRVYALLFIGVATIYAVGYAGAALRRRAPWFGLIPQVNIRAAVIVAGLIILVQLYPLDPMRLSAASQAARLAEGRVDADEFDFATLHFRLGHYGREALATLAAMREHPNAGAIAEAIAYVRAAPDYWTAKERREPLTLQRMTLLPPELQIPPTLLKQMSADMPQPSRFCKNDGACAVLGADFDGDGEPEYCFLTRNNMYESRCYSQGADGEWEEIGALAYRGKGNWPTLPALEAVLRADPPELRESRYRELILPDGAFTVVPK